MMKTIEEHLKEIIEELPLIEDYEVITNDHSAGIYVRLFEVIELVNRHLKEVKSDGSESK